MLVVGTKRHAGEEHLLLEQRDNTKAYIPAWMTDPARAKAEPVAEPRIDLAALEDLRRLLDSTLSSPRFCSAGATAKGGKRNAGQQAAKGSVPRDKSIESGPTRSRQGSGQGMVGGTDHAGVRGKGTGQRPAGGDR